MDLDLLSLFPQIEAIIMEGGERNQALKVCNNGGEKESKNVCKNTFLPLEKKGYVKPSRN